MSRRWASALCVVLTALAAPVAAQNPKDEVLRAVDDLFKGLRTKDTALVAARTDSLTRFTLVRPGPDGPRITVLSGRDFIRMAGNPAQPPLDEPTRNPVVTVDGDLATVWTEYQVRRDGQVTHCGYDAFHLARLGGSWKILNVSDSYRREGCGGPWPSAQH